MSLLLDQSLVWSLPGREKTGVAIHCWASCASGSLPLMAASAYRTEQGSDTLRRAFCSSQVTTWRNLLELKRQGGWSTWDQVERYIMPAPQQPDDG